MSVAVDRASWRGEVGQANKKKNGGKEKKKKKSTERRIEGEKKLALNIQTQQTRYTGVLGGWLWEGKG